MTAFLTPAQRIELTLAHKAERQKRFADRIKAVLLRDQGWSFEQIAEVLLLDDSTVRRVQESYLKDGLAGIAKDAYRGGALKMTVSEESLLRLHLQEVTYSSTKELVAYIQQEFDVIFSTSGARQWLLRNGFSHIKPRIVPGKASVEKQEEFLRQYRGIKSQLKDTDKIYFADACHPIHNSVAGYGWMPRGKPHTLKTTSGRDRLNLNGAIDPIGLDVIVRQEESLRSGAVVALLKQIEKANPSAEKIYFICDNARYYRSKEVAEWVKTSRIRLRFLPPYSPNLNLAERLWKFYRSKVMANVYYEKFSDFRQASSEFFRLIRHRNEELRSLMAENFGTLGFAG